MESWKLKTVSGRHRSRKGSPHIPTVETGIIMCMGLSPTTFRMPGGNRIYDRTLYDIRVRVRVRELKDWGQDMTQRLMVLGLGLRIG
jgi:hypothetical protein